MGLFQVSKCNRQPLQLSVSRGVRSRPLDEDVAASTKADTIPLLSPTMENELLKEPWVFSHTKPNAMKEEEDTAAFSVWEENFQDLSNWCMDTFQGQCDFHIGTKYEGNGVSTVEEQAISKDLKSTTDDDKRDLKMDIVKSTTEESNDNHHRLLLAPSELANEYAKEYRNEENNVSSSWLMSPESTASTSTSSSKQRKATDISVPRQSEHCANNDLDYACPASFDSTVSQRDTWDELRTIETNGSDTFDLLSYLCDDEVHSPEGSISTDSSAMLKLRPLAALSVFSPASVKVKTEEISEPPARRRMETRATSITASSSIEIPVASRRSERTRTMAINKEKERSSVRVKREKSEKKRYYEEETSDSDDDNVSQYRESREKNNEASRKSRMNKKAKESEMTTRAVELEKDNRILKMKVEELEKLVTSMRSALLRSALKKEF